MNSSTALETLVRLSADEAEAAAVVLGRALARREDAQQRLQMLQQLRADYAQRLQRRVQEGLPFAAYRNFQRFLDKIDEAIAGQTSIEAGVAAQAEQSRLHWQAKKREGQTWDLLVSRAGLAAQAKALRQERKATDEFAARAVLRRSTAETC